MIEKKGFFAYMSASAYHITISTEITALNKIEFLDTYVFLNNPH